MIWLLLWFLIGAVPLIYEFTKENDFTTDDIFLVMFFGILGPLGALLVMQIISDTKPVKPKNPTILIKKRKP